MPKQSPDPVAQTLTLEGLRDFLQNAPLYAKRTFVCEKPGRHHLSVNEIDEHCQKCRLVRPFQSRQQATGGGASYGGSPVRTALESGKFFFDFRCASCGASIEISVDIAVSGSILTFQKYGELPQRHKRTEKALERFFNDDLDNYRKAAACLAHGFGVGAFAYFRRIIESHVTSLLDLLAAEARDTGAGEDALAAIGELRKESPMSEKIAIANKVLPPHLKPGGMNPLGKMYAVLSDGVHAASDEACLEKARAVSQCLTYLVSELTASKKNREEFRKAIGGL